MEVIMWHKRRVFFFVLIGVVLYFFVRNNTKKLDSEVILPHTNAEKVWEFLADFSNIKSILVPHIEDFEIADEGGNYDAWKYSVKYNEPLPVWPYLNGVAVGHYTIKKDEHKFVISSETTMCFVFRWGCSKSVADFQISQTNQNTLFKETIHYDCPVFLNKFCDYLAKLTRSMFLENLIDYYKINQNFVRNSKPTN